MDPEPAPSDRVALYLWTPAVLVDSAGAPSLDLPTSMAGAARAAGSPDVQVLDYWFRPATASGWHGLAGLPKPQDPAIDAGAVVVLGQMTQNGLNQLLERGIGIRRLEGYGWLSTDPGRTEWALSGEASTASEDSIPVQASERSPQEVGKPQEAGTPAAPTQPPRPDPLDALLVSVPDDQQTIVVRRLLDAARKSQRMRQSGNDDATINMHVVRTLSQPWARDLAAPLRTEVEEILLGDDLTAIIVGLESRTGATG